MRDKPEDDPNRPAWMPQMATSTDTPARPGAWQYGESALDRAPLREGAFLVTGDGA